MGIEIVHHEANFSLREDNVGQQVLDKVRPIPLWSASWVTWYPVAQLRAQKP